ncbi:hypothetical protein CSKR_114289 [Clonorchis sinensis]|uniref:Uncharacterized protein n=1 Tax=Clonorchis sinensis TaxID=79923 RepID=A0A419Q3I4_CLOSI|nr:hypothetical protein CSKR_114289 [Clonorchis sinensis]
MDVKVCNKLTQMLKECFTSEIHSFGNKHSFAKDSPGTQLNPWVTIRQGSKTLICISFTKLNIHLLLERVFLNFRGYSLTVTQMQTNSTKRFTNSVIDLTFQETQSGFTRGPVTHMPHQ